MKDKNIYGSKMLPLPSPTFVVFYNGKQKMDEDEELRLSDAFVKKQEHPNREVIVKVKILIWETAVNFSINADRCGIT